MKNNKVTGATGDTPVLSNQLASTDCDWFLFWPGVQDAGGSLHRHPDPNSRMQISLISLPLKNKSRDWDFRRQNNKSRDCFTGQSETICWIKLLQESLRKVYTLDIFRRFFRWDKGKLAFRKVTWPYVWPIKSLEVRREMLNVLNVSDIIWIHSGTPSMAVECRGLNDRSRDQHTSTLWILIGCWRAKALIRSFVNQENYSVI